MGEVPRVLYKDLSLSEMDARVVVYGLLSFLA